MLSSELLLSPSLGPFIANQIYNSGDPPALDRDLTGGSQERTLLSLVQQGTALANPYTYQGLFR